MIITRSRTYRFNLGGYEHIEVSAQIEGDPSSDTRMATNVSIEETLTDLLTHEVERAVTLSANPDSFVHPLHDPSLLEEVSQ